MSATTVAGGIAATRGWSPCNVRRPYPKDCCIRIPKEIVHDPDPATYDQKLLFSTGAAPTFNSPDIDTADVWPLVAIPNLTATVRNLSTECSANQTRVDVSSSPWGIGLPRTSVATSFVDLARNGFPGSEQTLSWPTPPTLLEVRVFGLFIRIIHPYDTDPYNNAGEQTIDGFQTSTGRSKTFVVPVRNPSSSVQTIALTAGPASVASWVNVVPATFTLGAGARQNVMVSVDVPASIPPSPPGTEISATVDILATIGGNYFGGVSIVILFDA
jgi:hypothetical protein